MSYIQNYIQKLLAEKQANTTLSDLTSDSKVSIWREFLFIVAFMANFIKELTEVHQQEVEYLIDNQKLTSINYYRTTVLNYRHGHPFNRESLTYADGYTEEQIEAAKLVKRAAVQPVNVEGRRKLFLKLATENANGELSKIPEATMLLIQEYMQANIGAGTYIEYFSDNADELKMEMDIYIDPLVLNTDGTRIDGTDNEPVPKAIQEFFKDKNFKFDGELVLSLLADKIQEVQGVESRSVSFKKVEASYTTPASFNLINERYTANSGYFRIAPENLKINYKIRP